MKKLNYIFLFVLGMWMAACQNKDIEIMAPIIDPIDENLITGQLEPNGYDYTWTWPAQTGKHMEITVRNGNSIVTSETTPETSFTHRNLESNVNYTYVFKLSDGTNLSTGVVKSYCREGASPVTGMTMKQLDNPDGSYDALVEWTPSGDADSVELTANSDSRNISETLPATASNFTIKGVKDGEEWNVTIIAKKAGGVSLPTSSSLKIGKTAIGFLSIHPDPETHVANADDDEACAWLWLHEEYPSAQFIYFGNITSAEDLTPFRVLFWLRDLDEGNEDVLFNVPQVVADATPAISEWYANGGNILLWSHATAYITNLGRLEPELLRNNDRSIGFGVGGWNPDTWKMAVQLHPGSRFKKDASSHPIFRGLDVEETDRTKLIAFKGPGWTEDHNCLYFNIPSVLTGIGNQEEACYNEITGTYGIYPLGTWDSQIDWVSQLNVWEAQQGNTQFKGTILCIGNGGCEFSMKNADGTPDISAYPSNNQYQGNVLKLASNSLEYLKTR